MRYHDLKSTLRNAPGRMLTVRAAAIRAILSRAQAVIGASKKETKRVSDTLAHRPQAELNVEQTIENILVKPYPDGSDVVVDRRIQKRLDCALMLDTSLSMGGEKLALLAVAATVLAYRLPSEDFALVAFESTASTLKRVRVKMSADEVAKSVLEVPAMGYTNIEAALLEGIRQLVPGRHKNRVGILLTDGKYTAGGDPIPAASRFRMLHVVLLGDFNTDRDMCSAIAAAGHGRVYKASSFANLPRTLHRLLGDLLT